MIARMDIVHNAARMAMADHRAADPVFLKRRPPLKAHSQAAVAWLLVTAAVVAAMLVAG
jgi:hypothetical protein